MSTKYYNDAIIGNKQMVASFTKTGELLRIYYPNIDFRQFIDYFHVGVKINDSNIVYLHNDINNQYNQKYVEGTNILETEILNTYFKLNVTQTDFVWSKQNMLIKKYKIKNDNAIDLDINLIFYYIFQVLFYLIHLLLIQMIFYIHLYRIIFQI